MNEPKPPRASVIVGLGNPGARYHHTRHNLGFLVIEALTTSLPRSFHAPSLVNATSSQKHMSKIFSYSITIPNSNTAAKNIMLVQPQTYMNKSGEALLSLMKFNNIAASDLIVIYDDVSLPFGVMKLRTAGSSGGHNGVASIIEKIGTNFIRLKCGIAPQDSNKTNATSNSHAFVGTKISLEKYVLNDFSSVEQKHLSKYCLVLGTVILSLINPLAKLEARHHQAELKKRAARTASLINGKHFNDINLTHFITQPHNITT
ncbi:peptidyl-tRNA hydrolase [Spirochaetota bacterium]|nr:peptidyl-tRNA hydrolase [Spirochaetota bacterium]